MRAAGEALRVWAPRATRVDLHADGVAPMSPAGQGWWASAAPVAHGTDYAFALDGGTLSITRPVYGGRAVAVYQAKTLPLVAKETAEGVTGVMPHVPFGEKVPGMKALEDFHKANHPTDTHDAMYTRGWATATVWIEAEGVADSKGTRFLSQGWILDLGSRKPAWTMSRAEGSWSRKTRNWRTEEEVRLAAGSYVAYFAAVGGRMSLVGAVYGTLLVNFGKTFEAYFCILGSSHQVNHL